MNKYQEMYKEKLKSAEEIAKYVESGFVLAAPSAMSQPVDIVEEIGKRARRGEIENVSHHSLIAQEGAAFLDEALAGKYYHVSWFTSAPARAGVQKGIYGVMPCNYSQVPMFWRDFVPHLDVFYAVVSPMDKHGYFSFGLTASENLAQISRAKYVFLEVNDQMPRVIGTHIIHISQATAVCETSHPIPTLPEAPISETDMKIGSMISELIPDRACIQLGIGGIPNAVGKCLFNKKELGIHSELFTDSMVDLIEAGVVTNEHKRLNRGKSVAAFAMGSKKMYDFLDNNLSIDMRSVDFVNDPYNIGKLDNFISINSCLEIDFTGQVCAESIGHKNFSGTGGQADFVRGCANSKGGKSFIAVSSTAKGGTISKIRPFLSPGAAVTTTKNDVDYIATEFGIARLKGKTVSERTKALIAIAHPKFREELTAAAKELHYII